jgi:DNA repair protein RadC
MKNKSNKYEPIFLQLLVKEYDRNALAVENPKIAVDACKDLFSMPKEILIVLCLDAKNRIMTREIVSVGTLTASLLHSREIFRLAILKNSNSIIVLHNHPSGDTTPSENDMQIAERLFKAGKLLGISMLDFIVFNKESSFYSYTDSK